MTALTDADLLGRYLSDRDESAFAAIVRKHGPMVFGACRRVTAHHHDAEDAFQAAFLVLAARAEAVRPKERLGAWLHGVAVRCGRKARDAARRSRSAEPPVEPAVFPSAVEPDLSGQIDAALAAIPDTYRAAVVLCHLEGRSRAEAARELGWSEGTLSGRLHRALDLLARRLTARGVTASGAAVLAVLSARTAAASVPTALAVSTSSAASLLTAGFDQPAGPAASLAAGVVRAMSFRKLKLAAAVLVGVMGVGSFAVLNTVEAKPTGERAIRRNAPVPVVKRQEWKELFAVKHEYPISAVASHPDLLATGDSAGGLTVWEQKTGREFDRVMKPKTDGKPVAALQFTTDGKWLLGAAESGGAVWRTDVTRKGDTHGIIGGGSRYSGFSANGMTWVEQDRPRLIMLRHNVWDQGRGWKGEPYVAVAEPGGRAITQTALSADDTVFAMASEVPVVRVFDRGTNKERHEITLKEGQKLSALKLSDDGKRLAVIGEKGFARVFDAEAGKELCELKGHDGTVNAVAFTPDGSQVATANGKVVRVFDAKSGKQLSEIKGHADEVTCLAFAPDGKRLVTGSKDKTAKVWEAK